MFTIYHVSEEEAKRNTMIKNVYYRPDGAGRLHIALRSGPHYKAVLLFLTIIDLKMNHISNALKPFKPLYSMVFGERDRPAFNDRNFSYDTWEDLENLTSSGNKEAKELRDGLVSWAEQYHLKDPQNMYIGIALRAIFNYFPDRWPSLYLHDGLGGADDEIVDEFVRKHPFVFAPSWEALSRPLQENENHRIFQLEWEHEPERYEHIPSQSERSWNGFVMPPHNDESWTGFSWDPRDETWTDFSRKMQRAFEKYKDSYKERMSGFMKQNGYVEIPKGMRKDKLDLHINWFIERHFFNKQYKEIAEEYSKDNENGITERNISNAVKEISDLVLLPLDTHE